MSDILKQVEFYFGDTNFPYDKFLYTTAQKNDGWVDISTIMAFKRMQKFTNKDDVVSELRKSPTLLEVNEDGTKVRRKTELVKPDDKTMESRTERTVYAKNFEEPDQEQIEAYFNTFGPTKQVRLRRTDTNEFKHSVFVEFEDLESAKNFVSEKREYKGQELLVMSKRAYVDMKSEQHNFSDQKPRKPRFNAFKQKPAGKSRKRTQNFKQGRDKRVKSD